MRRITGEQRSYLGLDRGRSCRLLSLTAALLLALGLSTGAVHGEDSVTWSVVAHAGEALPLERNSHATAAAWLAKYHGLQKPRETDRKLIATLWGYMQYCECDEPGQPVTWRILSGMQTLCAKRGYPHTPLKERCRYSNQSAEVAGLDDYLARLRQDKPVILTFCYDPSAHENLARAARRVSRCLTVVGIGSLTYNDQTYLICHDGLTSGQSSPADEDEVSPQALHLPTEGKPWGQPGTSLYRWNGGYENLILLFMGAPTQ